eukprot:TRINITY_DN6511_c1_g1_i1.p1 TRINITY_DN6511_c1_g1~~TRINITY_DN6511_c1_g1_i1.p1  ORF type:complete len:199 (+),score=26.19 TRINITY_DN6511_c1_g1_i1:254-850(+)
MLQTRQFAYADTQRYRLGVNNQMLPVNRPKCDYTPRQKDGVMNFNNGIEDEVNYFPSMIDTTYVEAKKYAHDHEKVSGIKTRTNIDPKMSDFQQAGDRYRSFESDRQDRFAKRIASSLSGQRISSKLYDIWVGNYWTNVDANLAKKIKSYRNELVEGDQFGYRNEIHEFRDAFLRASGAKLGKFEQCFSEYQNTTCHL